MELEPKQYYHLYNRSNNDEIIFKDEENFSYFLGKYNQHLSQLIDTIAFCLMPTHFHFLIYIQSDKLNLIRNKIGLWLSSYTKAINKRYNRHGSLFQEHTKAKHIDDEEYLLSIINYIHQNPIRGGLIKELNNWEFSSYWDYIEKRKLSPVILKKTIIQNRFNSIDEFISFSHFLIPSVEPKYWV
jgi:REP element-mobilizing transposase RayT